jgi:hypothetical protein
MHKIYELNGNVTFFYEIPKMIYSTFISTMLNIFLRYLSLSENNILLIKKQMTFNMTLEQSIKSKRSIYIKIIIYYIITFLLMIFYWYFTACFCAVYNNTQIILIKNCLISFTISLIYPFFLYLIPSLLRNHALKAKKKGRETIYKISRAISLF